MATALDFDDVVATRYQEVDGRYTGRLVGKFAWGRGKRDKVREWAATTASTSPTATHTPTASSTSPSSSAVGTPTR